MKKVLLIILVACCAGLVQAQDSTTQPLPVKWSLEDCISYARTHNIQLSTLRLNTALAEEDLLQSKANRLPNLAAVASQSLVHSNNTNPVVGGFQTQASLSGSYGLSSSLTVFNGSYLKNDIRSKQLSVQSANLTVEETANDITLSITQAFLNILLTKENITALSEVLSTSQAQLKQQQLLYDGGSISKKDLLQFQSQLATDNYNLITAKNNYELNTVALKQLLQLPTSYHFEVAVPGTVSPQQAVADLATTQAAARAIRPEVKNKQLATQISALELAKVKAGRLPVLSLGAGLSSGYSDNQNTYYFSQLDNNFYQSLGLTLSIPIFSRRQNKTNIAKSTIAIRQAKLDLLNTETVLDQQVEQAYINLQNAQAQFVAASTQLETAQQSYDITNGQLRLGAITTIEVLQQKNAYVQALQAFTQAKYTAVLYTKIYDFYAGQPVTF